MKTTVMCIVLLSLAAPAAGQVCVDEGASAPDMVRIQVFVEAAEASATVDGDNPLFENEADLRPQVSINGGPFQDGPYIAGDDTPQFQWMAEAEVPRQLRAVPIRIRLVDRDQPFDDDDWIDLDPNGGCDQDINHDDPACSLELSFDPCCYSFSGDGTNSLLAGCPGGVCAGGPDGHWLGPGDHNEHARVRVMIQTGNLATTCNEADVAVTGTQLVQVVDEPGFAVGGRGSILRVTMTSSYPENLDTSVVGWVGDVVSEVSTEKDVTLAPCTPLTENLFVADPAVVDVTVAHYGAQVDPLGLLPYTDPCVRLNDGAAMERTLEIRPARDLDVVYQRIFHWVDCPTRDCDILSRGDADVVAGDADVRIRGIFPAPEYSSFVDPLRLPIPFYDPVFGPRTEIQSLSEAAGLLGLDRVVGLVPQGWVDRHTYLPLPEGTTGVSNGKIGPHFVYAESEDGGMGFTPTHELGHTFGLSDEPCSVDDVEVWALWKCEDEYQDRVFPTRPPGGFQGKGFDVPRGLEAAGTCLMDSDRDAWISNNDFDSLVRKMAPGHDPAVLVVTGGVSTDGSGSLLAAIGIPDGIPDRNGPSAPFNLALRDSANSLLGEYGIFQDLQGEDENGNGILEPQELLGDDDDNGIPDRLPVAHPSDEDADMNGIPDAVEHAEFSLRLPWPPAARTVQLVGPDGTILASLPIAVLPPALEIREPVGEVRLDPFDPATLLVPVRWNLPGGIAEAAAVAQGVTIASSYDGGQTWLPRAHRVGGNAFVIDARDLQAPLTMRLELLALADGPAGIQTVSGDLDGDRCPDPIDPAPTSPATIDRDGDGIPDVCDRCTFTHDPIQADADGDGFGDACDADYDDDGLITEADRTPGFTSCLGADVVTDPGCFDRDFDHDGQVTPADESFFDVQLAKGRPGPSGLVPTPPRADAIVGAPGCGSGGVATVHLDGSGSSDFDSTPGTNDDIVLFQWFEGYGTSAQTLRGTGPIVDLALPVGSHALTLRVTDKTGLTDILDAPLSVVVADGDADGVVDACDNCPSAGNPGQADGDADGAGDACDCAPSDPGARAIPAEVAELLAWPASGGPDAISLVWSSLAAQAGPGVLYDVMTGRLSSLQTGVPLDDAECAATEVTGTGAGLSQATPAAPDGWWYLVRGDNVCGTGTVGDADVSPDPRNALDDPGFCAPPAVLPIVALDLDVATPTVIDAARTLPTGVMALDIGVIVDARGSVGIGDIARVVYGAINSFNTGGATVASIVPLAIIDLMPPATSPYNALFGGLAGEFQFGGAIVEQGDGVSVFTGGPVQYARFRVTFATRPPGSTIRLFVGDPGPGTGAVGDALGVDRSGDGTPDGTPVGGVAGADQGPGAGVDYRDAVIYF